MKVKNNPAVATDLWIGSDAVLTVDFCIGSEVAFTVNF
jgi:hypothetical protein